MSEQFYIATGATGPALEVLCEDNDGTFRLTSASQPRFHMWDPNGVKVIDNATATITDPIRGRVRYSWSISDPDAPGTYKGRFSFTIAGRTVYFPSHRFIQINRS